MFFAIRHKPSGGFLPSLSSYGFTRAEPSTSDPPRLFKHKHSATQALNWWLRGESFEHSTWSDNDLGTERHIEIRTIHKPGRRRSDFEIVLIGLLLKTLDQAELEKL